MNENLSKSRKNSMKRVVFKTASGVELLEDSKGFYSKEPDAVIAALKEDMRSGDLLAGIMAAETLECIYAKGGIKPLNSRLHIYVSSIETEDIELLIISVNADRAALNAFKREKCKGKPIKVL